MCEGPVVGVCLVCFRKSENQCDFHSRVSWVEGHGVTELRLCRVFWATAQKVGSHSEGDGM